MRNLKADPAICTDDFASKLAVITGATSGIGYATAKKYASMGADLLFINRNEKKSDELCESLKNEFGVNCDYILADFSILSDTHAAAGKLAKLPRNIDVLIHNAGIYVTKRTITRDNLEAVFQTNYLSTFIINYSLREKFIQQRSGRILFVNSEAHRFAVFGIHLDDLCWEKHAYSGLKSYGAAKMAQLLSMISFSDLLSSAGVTINAMHPGNVQTNSGQNNNEVYKFFKKILIDSNARPLSIAAEALYYLGVSKELDKISGKFFNLTTEEIPAPPALDRDAAEKLWELSLITGGLYGDNKA
jgi:NAD(P)-dependent dehydrogenase (short-subunit alcohol dehydrogenase family)